MEHAQGRGQDRVPGLASGAAELTRRSSSPGTRTEESNPGAAELTRRSSSPGTRTEESNPGTAMPTRRSSSPEPGTAESASGGSSGDLGERLGLPSWLEALEVMERGPRRELWAGRDRRRGIDVVIKVVPPGRRSQVEAEARALARLGRHPHVANLSAVGVGGDGSGWLATDRVGAGSLADRRSIGVPEALGVAAQLASVLAHAHTRGVVHGDVTPSNVLLDDRAAVVLADFGCAGLSGAAGPGATEADHRGHTPRYAAPERRRGGPATRASDVYGLGATVAELLPPDRAGVPRSVRRLLRRCLNPDPRLRPTAEVAAGRLGPFG